MDFYCTNPTGTNDSSPKAIIPSIWHETACQWNKTLIQKMLIYLCIMSKIKIKN